VFYGRISMTRWYAGAGRMTLEMIIRILKRGFESHSGDWNFLWESILESIMAVNRMIIC
jgi:hypothetical protein